MKKQYEGSEDIESCVAIEPDKLKALFERRLFPLYPFMKKDCDDFTLAEWYRIVRNYSEYQLDKAVTKWIRSKEGAKRYPLPGDIIQLIPISRSNNTECFGDGSGFNYWGLFKHTHDTDDNGNPVGPVKMLKVTTALLPVSKSVDEASNYFRNFLGMYEEDNSLSGYTVRYLCSGEELVRGELK